MKYSNLGSFQTFIEAWFAREVVEAISGAEGQAQREAIKNGLEYVTPEVLVRAVFTLSTSIAAVAEADHRLAKTPLANRFAFRVLVGWRKQEAGTLRPKDAVDLDDAVDGLSRCCFAAVGDWSVPADRPSLVYNHETEMWERTDRRVTAAFIEDRLLFGLEPYRNLSPQALLTAALERRFKNLPRAVKCDFMDEFDKANTKKALALKFASYGLNPELLGEGMMPSPDSRPDARQAIGLLVLAQDEFIEELGARNYETLLAVVDYAQDDDAPDTKQKRKSGATTAIERRLGLSRRQASDRKKQLHEALHRAQKNGGPAVMTLWKLLAAPPFESASKVGAAEAEEATGDEAVVQTRPLDQSAEKESDSADEDSAVFVAKDEED